MDKKDEPERGKRPIFYMEATRPRYQLSEDRKKKMDIFFGLFSAFDDYPKNLADRYIQPRSWYSYVPEQSFARTDTRIAGETRPIRKLISEKEL